MILFIVFSHYKLAHDRALKFSKEKEIHTEPPNPQVKPVIKMLKQTLVGTGALLVTAVMLFIFATPVEDFFQTTFATKENPSIDPASGKNTKYNVRYEHKSRESYCHCMSI